MHQLLCIINMKGIQQDQFGGEVQSKMLPEQYVHLNAKSGNIHTCR